mmetsp:Transcript_19869/g.43106  ORF Transcript_19869/g.43106 Transcript_19869/m.43106 type:complete len:99 (-) Transcript_19869:622-918(-)
MDAALVRNLSLYLGAGSSGSCQLHFYIILETFDDVLCSYLMLALLLPTANIVCLPRTNCFAIQSHTCQYHISITFEAHSVHQGVLGNKPFHPIEVLGI